MPLAGAQEQDITVDDLRPLAEALNRVKSDYVEPVGNRKLIEGALAGMLAALDPHSAYLTPQAYQELREKSSGKFGGLGLEVVPQDGVLRVVAPIDDTPAQKAGLRAGDLIVRLDSTPVRGLTSTEAVAMMRGDPGSRIVLGVQRDGTAKPLTVPLVRAVINITSVKGRLLEPDYAYLRVGAFQSETGAALATQIDQLRKQNSRPLRGLVLDLRDNPGGLVAAAVAVSDSFLQRGEIVSASGRTAAAQLRFAASPGDVLDNAPLVVLINGGSASAAEIVAGALQDQHRAVLMGSRSFGKGSVQTIFPAADGSALKITTSRYYTPSGRSIQAEGITPDIMMPAGRFVPDEQADGDSVREADLSNHLVGATSSAGTATGDASTATRVPAADALIVQALTMLKGLNILSH